MKWGVRRYQNKDGSITPAGRKRAEKAAEKEREQKEQSERLKRMKPIRTLTDAELKQRIERLSMEKQYKDLVRNVEPVATGRKIADRILESSLENIGKQTVTYLMGAGINKLAKEVFGATSDIVNPKKGQKDN